MATLFSLLLNACGLSHREVAEFLKVRPDTVKSWAAGRRQPREEVLTELAGLYARIERSATEALKLIEEQAAEHGAPDEIDLALAPTDAAARRRGWPCIGAQAASLGIVVARGMGRGKKFRII